MYRVALFDEINVDELLSREIYEWDVSMPDPHIILVRSRDLKEWAFTPSLLAIGRCGVGVNNIPINRLTSQGIPVFNTPGANENAVKELVIAALLLTSRNLLQAHTFLKNVKDIQSDQLSKVVEEKKRQFIGHELQGKTIGIIGLGHIGSNVAQIAPSLGLTVLGYDPYFKNHHLLKHVQVTKDIDQVFREADFITLHIPLNQETSGLVDKRLLGLMKPQGILINLSRGEVVDNLALKEVLLYKPDVTYLSDFPMEDLFNIPQVILLPHMGGLTKESDSQSQKMIVHSISEYILHGNMINAVNFPMFAVARQSPFRLTLFGHSSLGFKDSEDLIRQSGMTIIHTSLCEQESMAYGIYDLREPLPSPLFQEIQHHAEIIKSRYIPLKEGIL